MTNEPEDSDAALPAQGGEGWDSLKLALGDLVVAFGELEGIVAITLATMLDSDTMAGTLVTSQLGFRKNVEVLTGVFREYAVDGFASLRPRLLEAAQQRDIYIHSIWDPADEQNNIRLKWNRRSGELTDELVLVSSIAELVKEMRTLYIAIDQLP